MKKRTKLTRVDCEFDEELNFMASRLGVKKVDVTRGYGLKLLKRARRWL